MDIPHLVVNDKYTLPYRAVSDFNHQILVFNDYGKGFVKSHKLSPDSFIQIALQLTFYKYICKGVMLCVSCIFTECMDT